MTPIAAAVINAAPDWLDWVPAEGDDGWGREWLHSPLPERLGDPEAYIHHTAGPRYSDDPRAAMRTHQTSAHRRGYATVAYDQMVVMTKSTGRVAVCEGRGGWRSAATRDRNEEGEAICLVGYFHPGHRLSEQPHPREIEALAWALAFSIASDWNAATPVTLGHRDNPRHPGATACPGNFLYPHVPGIGDRALQIIESVTNDQEAPDMGTLVNRRNSDTRQAGGPISEGVHGFALSRSLVPSTATRATVRVTAGPGSGYLKARSFGDESDNTSTANRAPAPEWSPGLATVNLQRRPWVGGEQHAWFEIVAHGDPGHVLVDVIEYWP